MDWYVLLGVAIALALDACAVAVGISVALGRLAPRQVFRLVWHFGLFQALMPVIGWLGGVAVESWIRAWDHWVAFALLAVVGGRAVVEALRGDDDGRRAKALDPTRGLSLVVLSVATSIDALAVGLSLGALGITIWVPAVVIGVTAAALTAVGIRVGGRIGARGGRGMEAVGGLVLIAIGCKILVEHLASG